MCFKYCFNKIIFTFENYTDVMRLDVMSKPPQKKSSLSFEHLNEIIANIHESDDESMEEDDVTDKQVQSYNSKLKNLWRKIQP